MDARGQRPGTEPAKDVAAKAAGITETPSRSNSLPNLWGSVQSTADRTTRSQRDSGVANDTYRSRASSLVRTPVDDQFLGDLLGNPLGFAELRSASKPRPKATTYWTDHVSDGDEKKGTARPPRLELFKPEDPDSPEPTCPGLSNRLEDLLEVDHANADKEEDAHTSSNYTDAEEAEADHDRGGTTDTEAGEDQEASDETASEDVQRDDSSSREDESDSDETSSNTTPGPTARMARATTRKFERPPTFSGLDEEDVVDWIRRYESVARYNGWNQQDQHDNLEMYLKGSAEKWYNCLSPATTAWEDTTADVTVNGVLRTVTTRQDKSRLLEAFKKGNYEQFQEGKLRNRKQLPNESATEYYYDVVSLCKSLDPNMSDQAKVNYLMGGLNAD